MWLDAQTPHLISPMSRCLVCSFVNKSLRCAPTLVAFPLRSSFSITSRTARPMAQDTGFPPNYMKMRKRAFQVHCIWLKQISTDILLLCFTWRQEFVFCDHSVLFVLPFWNSRLNCMFFCRIVVVNEKKSPNNNLMTAVNNYLRNKHHLKRKPYSRKALYLPFYLTWPYLHVDDTCWVMMTMISNHSVNVRL